MVDLIFACAEWRSKKKTLEEKIRKTGIMCYIRWIVFCTWSRANKNRHRSCFSFYGRLALIVYPRGLYEQGMQLSGQIQACMSSSSIWKKISVFLLILVFVKLHWISYSWCQLYNNGLHMPYHDIVTVIAHTEVPTKKDLRARRHLVSSPLSSNDTPPLILHPTGVMRA